MSDIETVDWEEVDEQEVYVVLTKYQNSKILGYCMSTQEEALGYSTDLPKKIVRIKVKTDSF